MPAAEAMLAALIAKHTASDDPTTHIQADGGGWHAIGFHTVGGNDMSDAAEELADRDLIRKKDISSGDGWAYELRPTARGKAYWNWRKSAAAGDLARLSGDVLQLVDAREFADRHPSVATNLADAFALVSTGDLSDVNTTSTIGHHLRYALIDMAGPALSGLEEAPPEDLKKYFEPAARAAVDRGDYATRALILLAQTTLHLDQGLNHARDERYRGHDVADGDTIRRAAWVTAVTCLELDRRPLDLRAPDGEV